MRGLTDERGAVAVVVAVILVAMLGFGALVVDVGSLYGERRVLQNAADAAALALAKICGAGSCGSYATTAQTYADDNNPSNGPSITVAVCGNADVLPACATPPTVPSGASYVRVDTSATVDYTLARAMGFTSGTVSAYAIADWGGPSGLTSALPLTISVCEFAKYSDADGDGDVFDPNSSTTWDTDSASGDTNPADADLAPPPPYPPYPSSPYQEATLYMHDTTGANGCPDGPSGSDLPGGWGWLTTTTGCTATSSIDGWFANSTGVPPPNSCKASLLAAAVGTVVEVPVFTNTNNLNGNNGSFYIQNYAAFYLTGYSIVGQYNVKSVVTGQYPCSGQATCISGYFVDDTTPVTGQVGGAATGVVVINLIA